MRYLATVVALILMGWGTPASAQSEPSYSDEQINAAIEVGYNDDLDRIMHSCNASVGGFFNKLNEALSSAEGQPLRAWQIHGQAPLARVAQEADFARRRYTSRPTPDDVRDLLQDDVFTIWAEPDTKGDMRTAQNLTATNVETVVIRPRGDSDGRQVVQPLSVDVTDGTVASNLFGASVQVFGVVATFDSAAVREIIAQSDLEVLLITGSREEFKCNLDDTRLQRGYNPS